MNNLEGGVNAYQLAESIQAERSLLGCLLLESKAYSKAKFLGPSDFASPANAEVFKAIRDVKHSRRAVDLMTVARRIGDSRLEMMGGLGYLASLMTEVPTAVHVEHYARIVQRRAELRRMKARR